jgi:hypothetical protein
MAFDELAIRMIKEEEMEAQKELDQATNQKKQANEMMDIELAKLKISLNDIKSLENMLKMEQKQQKLDQDLVNKMAGQQANVFVGGTAVPPQVAPDAADVPFLDQIA